MNDIKFKLYPGMGPQEAHWQHAQLDEFLLNTPVFIYELKMFGVIPPIHILNERFLSGKYDAGMGGACEWNSFQLTIEEYNELVESLVTNPEYEIKEDKELWVHKTFEKWHGKLMSKRGRRARK